MLISQPVSRHQQYLLEQVLLLTMNRPLLQRDEAPSLIDNEESACYDSRPAVGASSDGVPSRGRSVLFSSQDRRVTMERLVSGVQYHLLLLLFTCEVG